MATRKQYKSQQVWRKKKQHNKPEMEKKARQQSKKMCNISKSLSEIQWLVSRKFFILC